MKDLLIAPLGIAGAGIGLGIVGEAFDSEGLIQAGKTTTGFIAPAIAISAGGFLIKQLKEIDNEEKKEMSKEEKVRVKFRF